VIPYGRQYTDDDDIDAVVRVLKSEFLTQGPAVEEFEKRLCDVTGAHYAVAFANGTAALHGAVAAAEVGPGSLVATSALTFNASAACARYVGATPTLVDIEPSTLNLDPEQVPRCDALVAVHYAGLPVDLARLPHRPRVVIEDASHALGARTADGPVGGCARSDMCTFSFHPVKTVTTGEGGAVTTNSEELARRLRTFRHHGIVRDPSVGAWYYEIPELGYNYRLTDIQAALGASQLAKLPWFVARRNELAARYRLLLRDARVELPPEPPTGSTHAYHLFPIQVAARARVFDLLRERHIGVQVHYVPLYRHPMWAEYGWAEDSFPATEAAYSRLLSLPMFPALRDDEQDRVVTTVIDVLRLAGNEQIGDAPDV